MFDSEYFRTILHADVDAVGGSAVVELHLLNGRTHTLRSVLSVHSGYATCEAYRTRGDMPVGRELLWKAPPREGEAAAETFRAVVAYESVATVSITAAAPSSAPKIGFARP
ncbi:MAG TPA: hypothetical protein VFJ74_01790 [Gemmatimonadaceae bacterium]|nr:hypothetical protein [Gemmatimonadaceae bacterium]